MRQTSMCVVAMWVALAALCLPRPVGAQTPDEPYGKVKGFPGVLVTDAKGSETKGKLVSWTGSEIVLQTDSGPRIFKPGDAVRLDLHGDSVKNGALIGMGIGLGAGFAGGAAMGSWMSNEGGGAAGAFLAMSALGAGIGAAAGAGFDGLRQGQTVLFRRSSAGHGSVSVAPVLTPTVRALHVSMRF